MGKISKNAICDINNKMREGKAISECVFINELMQDSMNFKQIVMQFGWAQRLSYRVK